MFQSEVVDFRTPSHLQVFQEVHGAYVTHSYVAYQGTPMAIGGVVSGVGVVNGEGEVSGVGVVKV